MSAADILSRDMKRLQLRTKTVGGERIQRAKDNNEDVAILSMFLPGSLGEQESRNFRCNLRDYCMHGDPRLVIPGILIAIRRSSSLGSLSLNSNSSLLRCPIMCGTGCEVLSNKKEFDFNFEGRRRESLRVVRLSHSRMMNNLRISWFYTKWNLRCFSEVSRVHAYTLSEREKNFRFIENVMSSQSSFGTM